MKTISTKLETDDHNRFLELCNKEGCTVSEMMRDLITGYCENCKQPESKEEQKLIPQIKVTKIVDSEIDESKSHYDRFGNYWTFDKKFNRWTCHVNSKNNRHTK